MGSDESHFNVSLIVRAKVTRQCPQTTTFEEKGEPKWNRTEVHLTNLQGFTARPIRLTEKVRVCVCVCEGGGGGERRYIFVLIWALSSEIGSQFLSAILRFWLQFTRVPSLNSVSLIRFIVSVDVKHIERRTVCIYIRIVGGLAI